MERRLLKQPALYPSVSTMSALAPAASPTSCRHCGASLFASGEFCCAGCETVWTLLHREGLSRYYDLGRGEPVPEGVVGVGSDRKWLEPLCVNLLLQQGTTRLSLDLQGLHCAACVWLIESLFARHEGGSAVLVNPARGELTLHVAPSFDLAGFVTDVERFGYRLGPHDTRAGKGDARGAMASGLVFRMGVAIAIAMNTMIFGIATYAGLSSGPLYRLFQGLSFAFSCVSVAFCGSVFIFSAARALRRGILHLDLPIATGIVLAFASSTYSYFARGGATSFFDTLNVFIALMLVGRYCQERVLAKNRAQLLSAQGVDNLYARRIRDGIAELVSATQIAKDDTLLITPGDLVLVDARVQGTGASFSLDWISGESDPRTIAEGESVPAGAFLASASAVVVRAATDFADSILPQLLCQPSVRDDEVARSTRFWRNFARIYVLSVLALAASAFALWMVRTHDLVRALDVVASVLIVTCPCAFGIATPLAYEIVQAKLRRLGLMVRTAGFFDRALAVRRVVFDKTGTLTTGKQAVAEVRPPKLARADRQTILNLALRSSHPKSQAIAAFVAREGGVSFEENGDFTEVVGKGIEARATGAIARLGAPHWAGATSSPAAMDGADVAFARRGHIVASFRTEEQLRPEALRDVASLSDAGYETWILSGDAAERTEAVAARFELPAARVILGASPHDKEAWLRAHDHGDTLFIGDGINDALVAGAAHCSGTPTIDRPFMASRTDFYFVTPGLKPVLAALRASRTLARVVKRNLAVALAYNVVAVTLAFFGLVSPLVCAVLMPLSSLSTILATLASLSHVEDKWTS